MEKQNSSSYQEAPLKLATDVFYIIGQSQQIRGEFQYMPTATPNTITKAPTTPAFHNDVRSFTSYAKIKYCSHQNRKEA